jgi:hypothetical protein
MSKLNNNIATVQILNVTSLNTGLVNNFDDISAIMDQLPRHGLFNNSWPQYKTVCTTDFSIAHTYKEIMIKFYILNDHFGSKIRNLNGDVHQDNCVEFFVSFDGGQAYYNIEFNCLGIGKMAFGKKGEREFLPPNIIRTIRKWVRSDIINKMFDWEIILCIPATAFIYHKVNLKKQLSCSGNFYKCGDGLPEPHYLTWNIVEGSKPDFHRPDHFGEIIFGNELMSVDFLENVAEDGNNIF